MPPRGACAFSRGRFSCGCNDLGEPALSHACVSRRHLDFCWRVDLDLGEARRQQGCVFCGGVLHRANYLRQPRGLTHALAGDDRCRTRLSFCCNREGCRRRTTPPSVRFLGRRLFVAPLVVLLTAMRCRRRVRRLCRELEVDRRTLERWRRWWDEECRPSRHWRALRGRMARPPEGDLPRSLLDLLGGLRLRPIRDLLRHLGPLTGGDNMRAF